MTTRLASSCAVLVVGLVAFALLYARPAEAQSAVDPGQNIVNIAMQDLGKTEGQCFPWVRKVIERATGRAMGYGYHEGYLEGGAVEVPLEEARTGDVIQIADPDDNGSGADYDGLHTAIVMSVQDSGEFYVIDSNSQWDGVVRLRTNYDPMASAARYPNLGVRVYRFTEVADPAEHDTQAQSLTPGGLAVVSADGDCLRLRSAPGGTIITCIPDGSLVNVLEGSTSYDGLEWQYISYGGSNGWVAAIYLEPVGGSATATPTPTPSGPAGGTISGSLPSRGTGLIVWGGGSVESLLISASGQGCAVRSVWVTVNGAFLGYTAGAPAFVNQSWNQRYPGTIPGPAPLIVVCAGSGSPPAPTSTPPPSGTVSPPTGDTPPGPAGNELTQSQ